MAHMAPYRHPSGQLDPPPTAKKRRKNAAPQPPPTQVPTIQDLLPPAPQGYGDTVIASNPFDDTPQIWTHRPHPMGRSPMGPMSPMMGGPISPYSPMVHSPMGGSPHLMGGNSPIGIPRGPPLNNNSCQMVRSPQMGLRQSPVSMGGCPPTSQAITTNAQTMGPPPMNFNNSCQMGGGNGGLVSGPPPMGMQMVGGFQGGGGGKSLSAGKIYPSDQPMVFNPQNPNAPPIYPCGVCHKEVHDNDQAILCESGCNFWFHRSCTGLTEGAFHLLTAEVYAEWVCDKCLASKHIPLVKFKP